MKTRIFSYKNAIGATTDLDNGIFLNNPKAEGQIGCVVSLDEVEITAEAQSLLQTVPLESGSFGMLMINKSSIALTGFWVHLYIGEDLCLGRDADLSGILALTPTEIELPVEFIEAVDDWIEANPEPEPEPPLPPATKILEINALQMIEDINNQLSIAELLDDCIRPVCARTSREVAKALLTGELPKEINWLYPEQSISIKMVVRIADLIQAAGIANIRIKTSTPIWGTRIQFEEKNEYNPQTKQMYSVPFLYGHTVNSTWGHQQ
jgi:hypothetical protein